MTIGSTLPDFVSDHNKKLIRASTIMAVTSAAGFPLNILLQALIAKHFGASFGLDAYNIALLLPVALATVMVDNIAVVFMPVFSEHLVNGRRHELNVLVSSLFKGAFLLLGCLLLVLLVFRGSAMTLLGPGFSGETRVLAIQLFVLMLPVVFFLTASGIMRGVLHAYYHFFTPAVLPLLSRVLIVAALILFAGQYGIFALTGGFVISSVLACGVMYFVFRRFGRFIWKAPWLHTAYGPAATAIIPLVAFRMLDQVHLIVPSALATQQGEGSVAILQYAIRVIHLPMGIALASISTAIFPLITRLIAEKDFKELARSLSFGLRLILVFVLPMAVGLVMVGEPVIRLIFERGAFGPNSSSEVYRLVTVYAAGILGWGFNYLLADYFWGKRLYKQMVGVAACGVASHLLVLYFLTPYLGLAAMALGFVTYTAVQSAVMLFLVNRQLPEFSLFPVIRLFLLLAASSAFMGVCLWFIDRNFLHETSSLMRVCVMVPLGVGLFYGAAMLLKVSEIRQASNLVMSKLPFVRS